MPERSYLDEAEICRELATGLSQGSGADLALHLAGVFDDLAHRVSAEPVRQFASELVG